MYIRMHQVYDVLIPPTSGIKLQGKKVSMLFVVNKMRLRQILTQLSISKKKTGRASCPSTVAILYISGDRLIERCNATFQAERQNQEKGVCNPNDRIKMNENYIQLTSCSITTHCWKIKLIEWRDDWLRRLTPKAST